MIKSQNEAKAFDKLRHELGLVRQQLQSLEALVEAASPIRCVRAAIWHKSQRRIVAKIKSIVAEQFELSPSEINSLGRGAERISWPRMVAMALSNEFSNLGVKGVGLCFGREHGSVFNAIRSIRDRCDSDPKMKEIMEILRTDIAEAIATDIERNKRSINQDLERAER